MMWNTKSARATSWVSRRPPSRISCATPGPEDLVYLSGGENREFDVADFPRLGKRMVRMGNHVDIYDAEDAQPFGPITR